MPGVQDQSTRRWKAGSGWGQGLPFMQSRRDSLCRDLSQACPDGPTCLQDDSGYCPEPKLRLVRSASEEICGEVARVVFLERSLSSPITFPHWK